MQARASTQAATAPGTVTDVGPVLGTLPIGRSARGAAPLPFKATASSCAPDVDEQERVPAQAAHLRLNHRQDSGGRDSRINRIAAIPEHVVGGNRR
jgi:hypothetical protein